MNRFRGALICLWLVTAAVPAEARLFSFLRPLFRPFFAPRCFPVFRRPMFQPFFRPFGGLGPIGAFQPIPSVFGQPGFGLGGFGDFGFGQPGFNPGGFGVAQPGFNSGGFGGFQPGAPFDGGNQGFFYGSPSYGGGPAYSGGGSAGRGMVGAPAVSNYTGGGYGSDESIRPSTHVFTGPPSEGSGARLIPKYGGAAHDGGSGNGAPITAGHPPASPTDPGGFVPSGTNGNPGFGYRIFGAGHQYGCQGTLTHAANGLCTMVTASHCLEDVVKSGGARYLRSLNAYEASVDVELPDFGRVRATAYLNGNFFRVQPNFDGAVLSWRCDGPGHAQVVPLATTNLNYDSRIAFGKVMGGIAGLYSGQTVRSMFFDAWGRAAQYADTVNGVDWGRALIKVVQDRFQTQKGDSGGGLYRRRGDGKLELVGILNGGSENPREGHRAYYATNETIQWARNVMSALGANGG